MKYDNLNTLLISTDFSDESFNAINYATEMALRLKLHIHLLHTISVPYMVTSVGTLQAGNIYPDVLQESEAKAKKRLEGIVQSIRRRTDDIVKPTFEIRRGYQDDKLIQKVEQNNQFLSIIGIEDDLSAWDVVLGNTTIEVMRKGFFPMLVVPEYASFKSVNNILYAVDEDSRDLGDLMSLISVARVLDANLQVVTTNAYNKDSNELSKFIDAAIDYSSYQNIYLHLISNENEDMIHTIQGFMKSMSIDLLAMQAKNRGFWANFLQPGDTFRMALKTDVPLLVFHEEE